MSKQKLGFFSLYNTDTPDSYIGAILITDENGIPLEFKCTHSIKPTAIQKSLYGDKLKPYIAINLCGKSLLDSVNIKPDIIFIDIQYIIGLSLETNYKVFFVRNLDSLIDFQADIDQSYSIKIDNYQNSAPTTFIHSHVKKVEDIKSLELSIQSFSEKFDILEPFSRIKDSIEILGKNDNRFR